MRRATKLYRKGTWPEDRVIGAVTLPFDERRRRRVRLADDEGEPFLLDLAKATLLTEGAGLALEDGGFIQVHAADEPVADIRCRNAAHAARVAWHIGNRHAPVQVLKDGRLRIGDDHVLVHMVEGLGAKVYRHPAPFSPEPGAYAGPSNGQAHSHDH